MNYIFSAAAKTRGYPLPVSTALYHRQILVKTKLSQYIDNKMSSICPCDWSVQSQVISLKSAENTRGPSFLHMEVGEQLLFVSGKDRAKVSSWVEFPVCNVWIQGRCQEFWRFYSREDSFLLGQNCNESTISSPVDALVLQKYLRLIIQLSC